MCGWVSYAKVLRHAGFRVLLIDHRGFGSSPSPSDQAKSGSYPDDLEGAVAELKREGATKIFLMGASFGGVTSMVAGSRLGSRISGVISLSGETFLGAHELDALSAVPKLRAPFLSLDGYLVPSDARRLLQAAGSEHKRLVLFPGGEHGWDLVTSAPYHARASRIVIDFLHRYS
jgi:alpha-beta hydrolase superfamily lysophospholipase